MFDFLGNKIEPGDFIAFAGGGNRTVEYGMILGKVIKPTAKGISVERIDVNYVNINVAKSGIEIVRKKINLTNLKKVMVVTPRQRIIQFFENAELEDPQLVADWIHGSSSKPNPLETLV